MQLMMMMMMMTTAVDCWLLTGADCCSWEQFTDAIVKELSKKQGIVYLLWGKPAQQK